MRDQDTQKIPVLLVDMRRRRFAIRKATREQPWYWVVKVEGNRKTLGKSSEFYTNRLECEEAIIKVFAASTTVFLRRFERDGWPIGTPMGLQPLRWSSQLPSAVQPY